MKINDVHRYQIQIKGQIKAEDITRTSPLEFSIDQSGEENTTITLITDQSGMIGLIRHLHGLGLMLLAVASSSDHSSDHFK